MSQLIFKPILTSAQDAQAMHGDVAQNQREVVLRTFREGKFKCLVSTDVAARFAYYRTHDNIYR